MKIRKSQSYLVISSAHIGVDSDILKVYAQVAKYFKAKVIHLGPLATDQEIKKYAKLEKDVSQAQFMRDNASTDKQEMACDDRLSNLESQFSQIADEQDWRIDALKNAFGNVTFVTTEDMMLPMKHMTSKANLVYGGLELSKYLFLSPVPPKGMKASSAPITARSISYLKELGKSWIVAHPIPEVQPFAKPGLNEAHNYYTVGCLKHNKLPTHTSNQYEFSHMPCAVMVTVDKDNGEFHAAQMHIDYLDKDNGHMEKHKQSPAVLHDGLVFTDSAVIETESADRASVGADYHARFQHAGVVGSHRALNVLFEPETLVDAGDGGSYESVSHWAEGRPGDVEGLRLKDDILGHRALLDAIDNVPSIKKRVMIDSNHAEWVTDYVTKHPALKGFCDWKALATDVFPDWEVYLREAGDNKILWFGDFAIRHGDKDGGVKKAEEKIPTGKYLCGHFHNYAAYRRAIQMGCGARLGPKYIGNSISAWQSQLSTLTKHLGITACAAKIILHDKTRDVSRFCFRDKIYEVDAYHIKA